MRIDRIRLCRLPLGIEPMSNPDTMTVQNAIRFVMSVDELRDPIVSNFVPNPIHPVPPGPWIV